MRIGSGFLRLAVILQFVGLLLVMFSLSLLPPLAVALWYGDGGAGAFALTAVLVLALGLYLWLPLRRFRHELSHRDGFAIVLVFWTVLPLFAAVPLELAGKPSLRVVDAVFEAASGITTTGATVLQGLDTLPRAILYYRAQLNFLGGMQLYLAETPDPAKEKKLAPRISDTARSLWSVYVALNIACILSFWSAGMNLFDAVCHSFATMALGGFSTHDASIAYFQSPAVEIVAGIFSIVAGINVALHFLAWRANSLRVYLTDPELRGYLSVLGTIIGITCAALYFSGTFSLWPAIYHGFFQSMSVVTDNGLVTAGYPAEWPAFIVVLLVLGSFFGGCAGSTGAGIKAIRFVVMAKQAVCELRLLLHPRAQVAVTVGGQPIGERVIQAVWSLFFVYVMAYCVLSLALMALGIDAVTAFGSVAGCMNNMGVGLGETASNFGGLGDGAKWVLTFSMLIGRFEVLPFLLLFTRDFWSK